MARLERYHVRVERYVKNLHIEANTLGEMVDTIVLPAVYAYHGALAKTVADAKAAGVKAPQADVLAKVTTLLADAHSKREALTAALDRTTKLGSEHEQAESFCNAVLPAMQELRATCDELELTVADDCCSIEPMIFSTIGSVFASIPSNAAMFLYVVTMYRSASCGLRGMAA